MAARLFSPLGCSSATAARATHTRAKGLVYRGAVSFCLGQHTRQSGHTSCDNGEINLDTTATESISNEQRGTKRGMGPEDFILRQRPVQRGIPELVCPVEGYGGGY